MKFGWDPAKNEQNLKIHGVDFEDAKEVFAPGNPGLDKEDERDDYREERRIRLGFVQDIPMHVVYTVRGQVIWIISARMAERTEEEILVAEVGGEKTLQQGKWEHNQDAELKQHKLKMRIEAKREREER